MRLPHTHTHQVPSSYHAVCAGSLCFQIEKLLFLPLRPTPPPHSQVVWEWTHYLHRRMHPRLEAWVTEMHGGGNSREGQTGLLRGVVAFHLS